jgi:hypothetical protein
MKAGDPAKEVNVSLDGLLYLDLIVSDAGDGSGYDHADWCEAKIEYRGTKPEPVKPYASQPYVLTPLPGPEPRINGAKVFGVVRPGSPFMFTIPATAPVMTFSPKAPGGG